MGIFGFLLLVLALIIGGILYLASKKPDVFRVERRASIKAPAAIVFAEINTIRAWEAWSPWQKKDPAMKQVYSGPAAGVGAAQTWEGNHQVGTGSMTIIESLADQKVAFQLEFLKPFKASNIAELTLQSEGNGTTVVVWGMHGSATLMSKVMDLLMNMDKMCGRDFDAGLANLKTICEAKAT